MNGIVKYGAYSEEPFEMNRAKAVPLLMTLADGTKVPFGVTSIKITAETQRTNRGVTRIMVKATANAALTPNANSVNGVDSISANFDTTQLSLHTVVTLPKNCGLDGASGAANAAILNVLAPCVAKAIIATLSGNVIDALPNASTKGVAFDSEHRLNFRIVDLPVGLTMLELGRPDAIDIAPGLGDTIKSDTLLD